MGTSFELKSTDGWEYQGIARITRWGLSRAIRLDQDLLRELGLKEGDKIRIAWGTFRPENATEARLRDMRKELMAAARKKIGVSKVVRPQDVKP